MNGRTIRTVIVLGGAAALTVVSMAVSNAMHAPVSPRTSTAASDVDVTTPAWVDSDPVQACANEDGSGTAHPCYWDAAAMGNGTGHGHYVFGPDGQVWDVAAGQLVWSFGQVS